MHERTSFLRFIQDHQSKTSVSTKWLALGHQAAALVVGQPKSSATALTLFLQNTVLFDQVGDQGRLLTANPVRERRQEKLQMDGLDHVTNLLDLRNLR